MGRMVFMGLNGATVGVFVFFFPFLLHRYGTRLSIHTWGPAFSRNVLYTHSLVVDMSIIAVRYRRSSFECLVESSGKVKGEST